MIEVNEILQTMQMIHEQHFDIRTITMGISLLDCKKNTDAETAECVFEKVTRCAGRLVAVGEELEAELESLEEELFGPAASDYLRAAEIDKRKNEVEERLMEIYEILEEA